jgi:hypothetical protein
MPSSGKPPSSRLGARAPKRRRWPRASTDGCHRIVKREKTNVDEAQMERREATIRALDARRKLGA